MLQSRICDVLGVERGHYLASKSWKGPLFHEVYQAHRSPSGRFLPNKSSNHSLSVGTECDGAMVDLQPLRDHHVLIDELCTLNILKILGR